MTAKLQFFGKSDASHRKKHQVDVTFSAENNPIANLNEYGIYNINWANEVNKVAKAENFDNQGEYHLFEVGPEGKLNVSLGSVTLGREGGEITISGRNNDPNSTTNHYVPIISVWHNIDRGELNTYGADIKKLVYGKLDKVTSSDLMVSEPFSGHNCTKMGYHAKLTITPKVKNTDTPRAYRYRVWRDNGPGTLLEPVSLLNDLPNTDMPDWDRNANYTSINTFFPANGQNAISINDLFQDKAIDLDAGETKTVTYYVRMYATTEAGYNTLRQARRRGMPQIDDDKYLFVSELSTTVTFKRGVITGLEQLQIDNEVDTVTYYDLMGHSSNRPFEGINIVVSRLKNGRVVREKVRF